MSPAMVEFARWQETARRVLAPAYYARAERLRIMRWEGWNRSAVVRQSRTVTRRKQRRG